MFENLRDAFKEAVDNFRTELSADEVPVTVDRLLLAMQNELAQARGLLQALEAQIAEATAHVAKDRDEEAICRRRAEMATRVGDAETARIALEFAVRHERRRVVLERKVSALDEERSLRVIEVEEMSVRVEEARSKRETLADAADAGDPEQTHEAAEDLYENLYDELDRMAGEMEPKKKKSAKRPAMDSLEREFRELQVDPWAPGPRRPSEEDVDAALQELKRRMGNLGKE